VIYPHLIVSTRNPAWSLDIYNAASSETTLRIMAIIAFLGMPFVISYTAVVYWVFRGKVRLGKFSY
jgi:cytochrome d ubiquinol oxidase subunit II